MSQKLTGDKNQGRQNWKEELIGQEKVASSCTREGYNWILRKNS